MRLENMLDINHELIKLSKHIDWESPDKEWGALFVSTKGAPAIRTRLIAGLHYLKHLHDLSDEQVVKGWTENPYWQYFCGEEYFQHKMPIHPATMTKWRNRPGKSGSEKLLIETIKAGLKSKTIKPGSLKKVTVDTTVQEKNIAFPTDSKLLNKARENLVKLSKEHGIKLRQNYNRVGPQYVLMASRYAHAKQFKRMKKMNNKLKSRLGRVKRDIERQLPNYSVDIQSLFEVALKQAQKLIEQEQHSRTSFTVYMLLKLSVSVKARLISLMNLVSYDGHTLLPQLEQIKQFTAVQPEHCFVDRGYHGHEVKDTKVFISGQKRGVTRSIKKALKRRSAIEPEIGHMKNDARLDCCYLKGAVGDAINMVMVAAGHNLRKNLNKLRLLWLKIISGLMGYFIKPEQSAALNLA